MRIFSKQLLSKSAKALIGSLVASLLVWVPAMPSNAYQSIDCSTIGLVGSGTLGDPIQIGTPQDLLAIDDCLDLDPSNQDALFQLTASIDMSAVGEIAPMTEFRGELDGDGFHISGLSISGNVTTSHAALFATATGDVRVKNLLISGSVENDAAFSGYSSLLFGEVDGSLSAFNITIGANITEATQGSTYAAGLLAAWISGSAEVYQAEVMQSTISAEAEWVGGLIGQADTVFLGSIEVFDLTINSPSQLTGYYGGVVGGADDTTGVQWSGFHVENLSIDAANGSGGGIIGEVFNSNIRVNGFDLTASSIVIPDGSVGGVAAKVDGDGYVRNLELTNVLLATDASWVGGAFGDVAGALDSLDIVISGLTLSTSAASSYLGGVAGSVVDDVSVFNASLTDLEIIDSNAFVGGIVGYSQDGGFTGDAIALADSDLTTRGSNSFVGGFAGTISGSFVVDGATVQNVTINAGGSFAGGYLGYSTNGGFSAFGADLIDFQITNQNQSSYIGGYLGSAPEAVTISYALVAMVDVIADGGFVGGFVGMVSAGGMNIDNVSISGITLVNGGNSSYNGGVAGSVAGLFELANLDAEWIWVESGAGFSGGLVGLVDSGVSISDLVLEGVHVESVPQNISFTGGLVGGADWLSLSDSTIENGTITSGGDWVGGLVGATLAEGQSFSRVAILDFSVEGVGRVGGIAGGVTGTGISHFEEVTLGEFLVTGTGDRVGGFIGAADSANILDSEVFALEVNSTDDYVGGLFGTIYGDSSTASGLILEDIVVDGNASVGGFAGFTSADSDLSDIDAYNVTISGEEKLGGLTGFQTAYSRLTEFNLTNVVVSARSGGSGYLGGISGYATDLVILQQGNISNVSVMSDQSYVAGLFGWASGEVSLSSLVANSISAVGDAYVSGIAGFSAQKLSGELVLLSHVSLSAQSQYVGALAGQVSTGNSKFVGLSVQDVTVSSSGDAAGGLFGFATVGTELVLADLRNIAVITLGDSSGGLIGYGVGVLTISHGVLTALSAIGDENVGSILGRSAYGIDFSEVLMLNLSATGSSAVGRHIGLLNNDDAAVLITQSYEVDAVSLSGALGLISGSSGSAQLPTSISLSESELVSTYLGWDFQNIWGIQCSANLKLPALRYITNGLQSDCSAPAPVVNNSTPNAPTYVYDGPLFTSISPKVVWSGSELVLAGNQLDRISKISVDGAELVFQKLSSTEIKLQVPAGLTLGIKDLRVSYDQGTLVVGSAFEVVAKPVVPVEKLTIVNFNGRVWVYFKNFANKPLFVKVAGKWFKVANSGKEVVSFSRKLAKGKSVLVTAYASGIRLETKQIIGR
jgi:hypothetical protein